MLDKIVIISKRTTKDNAYEYVSIDREGHIVYESYLEDGSLHNTQKHGIEVSLASSLIKGSYKTFLMSETIESHNKSIWEVQFYRHNAKESVYVGNAESFFSDRNARLLEKSMRLFLELPNLLLFGRPKDFKKITSFDLEIEFKQEHSDIRKESLEIMRHTSVMTLENANMTQTIKSDFVLDILDTISQDNNMLTVFPQHDSKPLYSKDEYVKYTLDVMFENHENITMEGNYDYYGLPKDIEEILVTINQSVLKYTNLQLFNREVIRRKPRLESDLIFCNVIFKDDGNSYYYITNDHCLKENDYVLVPVGDDNVEKMAKIQEINYYGKDEVPYNLDEVKSVIRKLNDTESILAEALIKHGIWDFKILEVSMANMDEMVEHAWQCYTNASTSFYPVIDHIDEVERIYKTAFMTGKLFAIEIDGKLGTLPIIVDHKRTYVQANGGIATTSKFEKFAALFTAILAQRFPNYRYLVGYPKSNSAAFNYHKNENYLPVESLIKTEFHLKNYKKKNLEIEYALLDDDNVEHFIETHEANVGNVYWDADNILDHLQRWTIVVGENNQIAGAIVYEKLGIHYAEVYFAVSENHYEAIVQALLNELKDEGIDEVLFMIEEMYEVQLQSLLKIGFIKTGDYHSFVKKL